MSDRLNRAVKMASATTGLTGQDFICAAVTTALLTMAQHEPQFAMALKALDCMPEALVAA
jgi:hypothetical protein